MDSTSWENYSNNTYKNSINPNSPSKTGAHEKWKANNIYDFAGNLFKWTNNTSAGKGIPRGGYYYDLE